MSIAKWLSDKFLEYRVSLLDLRPGDIIILKANQEMDNKRIHQIQEQARFAFGGHNKVVVLDSRFEISLVTAETTSEAG